MEQNDVTRRGFLSKVALGATALVVADKMFGDNSTATPLPTPAASVADGETLKVALLQMRSAITNPGASQPWDMIVMDAPSVTARQEKNIEIADKACRQAATLGADIALFPEMWNIGYAVYDKGKPNARESWQALAVDNDSAYVRHFVSLARELNMAIAVTYLQKWNPAPRNVVSIISRKGEIVLTYAKVHTCDFWAEAALTPGDDFPVCELDTKVGPVKVGCMICFDFQFPESAGILMLNGAELILSPVATGLPEIYSDQLKIRAFDNAVAIAATNYANLPFDGNAVAYDAAGYRLVDPVSGGQERLHVVSVNLRELREYRKTTLWGNAYRRPRKYKLLIAEDVAPIFARKDYFGKPFDRGTR